MTREELKEHCERQIEMCEFWATGKGEKLSGKVYEEHKLILELLEQESCEDCVSRAEVHKMLENIPITDCDKWFNWLQKACLRLAELSSVTPQQKTGHCKDCKYFEYDSVAKVDGIPLIVAHEICSKWGDGCKTSEDGYCFLFEPLEESEVEE